MFPPLIQKLIDLFSKFPTVGPRTATRFAFYLLKLPKEEIDNLISNISKLQKEVKICKSCFKAFQAEENKEDFCEICREPNRDKSLLCVIEKETDLETIEKTKKYKGLYFILGGTVSKFKKEDIKKLRTEELFKKAKNPELKEIIIATNPTTEGDTTALYLIRLLKPLGKKITRLGRGLPVGAELEYTDEETLSSAFESRR